MKIFLTTLLALFMFTTVSFAHDTALASASCQTQEYLSKFTTDNLLGVSSKKIIKDAIQLDNFTFLKNIGGCSIKIEEDKLRTSGNYLVNLESNGVVILSTDLYASSNPQLRDQAILTIDKIGVILKTALANCGCSTL